MINFLYVKSIIFFLIIFISQVNAETKIIAKKGDTLFKLSKEYNVQLKTLMHKNNFNDANMLLEGEIIILPRRSTQINNITYIVVEGDTLYKIARDYNVNVKDIVSINNLDITSSLKLGKIIHLPIGAVYKKVVSKENIKVASKKVFYHQTSNAEKLLDIVAIHNIPREEIITLNKSIDPTRINPNTKLKIRESKSLKWLRYGPLIINWSDWTYFDGHYITKAKNKKNISFYLAINCKKRTLNNTFKKSYWTSWYFPKSDFEFKLINDFCDHEFTI